MKKLYAFLLVGLSALLAAAPASLAQTIRRVNNTGITGTNIYSTLQAAHDAAAAGDIIQVEPSATNYGDLSMSKKLTIVGPGYFLGQNAGLQANPTSATVGYLYIPSSASGTSISGLTSGSYWYIGASDLMIQRCNLYYIYTGYSSGANNVSIRQNYVTYIQPYSAVMNNVLIANNIITGSVNLANYASGEFTNNVVLGGLSLKDFNVTNNYIGSSFTPNNSLYSYNLFQGTGYSTADGNKNNVQPSAVFVLGSGNQYDAWYQLNTSASNPAKGAGTSGADIGAFGGNTPYKLSGIPAIPSIYQFSQTVNGNTLNVNLSTRSNN
ncbi:hypothetical protein LRS06_16980 [Hymenobacter sp. J193]|uniref:hypothetical protein n=1 Tax=Hymenobacter sp. J193 TaxID=2898429 RepID=UPI002150FE91|nr:hypothetical protein [Hymenobacter sp. J193]MCR5889433.1 hypothetical protein [Hymenobacter sp. J193]